MLSDNLYNIRTIPKYYNLDTIRPWKENKYNRITLTATHKASVTEEGVNHTVKAGRVVRMWTQRLSSKVSLHSVEPLHSGTWTKKGRPLWNREAVEWVQQNAEGSRSHSCTTPGIQPCAGRERQGSSPGADTARIRHITKSHKDALRENVQACAESFQHYLRWAKWPLSP